MGYARPYNRPVIRSPAAAITGQFSGNVPQPAGVKKQLATKRGDLVTTGVGSAARHKTNTKMPWAALHSQGQPNAHGIVIQGRMRA